jgi:hypothetical protein
MDVDWTLINKAKNLPEDQIDQPILKLPIIRDYREPARWFPASEYETLGHRRQ